MRDKSFISLNFQFHKVSLFRNRSDVNKVITFISKIMKNNSIAFFQEFLYSFSFFTQQILQRKFIRFVTLQCNRYVDGK